MRRARPLKLVVDVNVLVSWLIGRKLAGIDPALSSERFVLVMSPSYLEELEDVIARPHLRKYFTLERAVEAMMLLRDTALILDRDPSIKAISRDPKDDYLLAIAAAAKADLLISGDKDLLVLERFKKTRILTPGVFMREFL
ncbi:MAG: putative toxin-antitoxin system toxin component, PIN family [Flavobacteriales bacterium]|nr:putative toxin-antitoxin system toxin component, PIN family [Flavobacteriales bacterium]